MEDVKRLIETINELDKKVKAAEMVMESYAKEGEEIAISTYYLEEEYLPMGVISFSADVALYSGDKILDSKKINVVYSNNVLIKN